MYLEYPSSQDGSLRLFGQFGIPREPRRLLVIMHGWHGMVKKEHSDNVDVKINPDWFTIAPEMRGRGDATGKPDCNGWELQDVVDAVEFAKRKYADKILDPDLVTLRGGSGGGGNVYALVGKFPDYFCRAQADCGITDYALWYRNDHVGEFRDELEGKAWVGGTPDNRPEAYRSRGGLTTVANLLTPLIAFHGELDIRVPSEHARRFVAEAQRLGKGSLVTYHEFRGVGNLKHFGNITPEQEVFKAETGMAFLKDNPRPIAIPRKGRFVVAGYVKTKEFEVILDSIDHIGEVNYDLDAERFIITAPTARTAILRRRKVNGSWEEKQVTVAAG